VKVPEVEVWAEGLLRPGPQLSDLELANLVAGGLTRPGDVASNLKKSTCYIQRCGTVTIYYGSGSNFSKVMVPVPAPYLDHKKQQQKIDFFAFYLTSGFTRKKFISFNKFIVKCE
jgi:hypothetical protein